MLPTVSVAGLRVYAPYTPTASASKVVQPCPCLHSWPRPDDGDTLEVIFGT